MILQNTEIRKSVCANERLWLLGDLKTPPPPPPGGVPSFHIFAPYGRLQIERSQIVFLLKL